MRRAAAAALFSFALVAALAWNSMSRDGVEGGGASALLQWAQGGSHRRGKGLSGTYERVKEEHAAYIAAKERLASMSRRAERDQEDVRRSQDKVTSITDDLEVRMKTLADLYADRKISREEDRDNELSQRVAQLTGEIGSVKRELAAAIEGQALLGADMTSDGAGSSLEEDMGEVGNDHKREICALCASDPLLRMNRPQMCAACSASEGALVGSMDLAEAVGDGATSLQGGDTLEDEHKRDICAMCASDPLFRMNRPQMCAACSASGRALSVQSLDADGDGAASSGGGGKLEGEHVKICALCAGSSLLRMNRPQMCAACDASGGGLVGDTDISDTLAKSAGAAQTTTSDQAQLLMTGLGGVAASGGAAADVGKGIYASLFGG